MGNSIRNAWNSFTEEEREDQNRANRYERNHRYDDDNNRRSNNRNSGNYDSSSSRDYDW
jgi:hypothetical protein